MVSWQCWILYFDSFCLVNIHDNEAEEFYPAALVCFVESEIEIDLFFLMKAVLLFISVAFLFLTLYVYYLLSELRETQVSIEIADKQMINYQLTNDVYLF